MEDFLLNIGNDIIINVTQIISIDKTDDNTAVIRMADGSVIPTQEEFQYFLENTIPERFYAYDEKD